MPPGLAVSLKLAVLRVSTLPGLFSPTAVVVADEGLVVAVLLLAGCRYMLVATQFSHLAGGFTSSILCQLSGIQSLHLLRHLVTKVSRELKEEEVLEEQAGGLTSG